MGTYSFFATHVLDRLVQQLAAQLTIVIAKATNAVISIADLKLKKKILFLTIYTTLMTLGQDIRLTCAFQSHSDKINGSRLLSAVFFERYCVKVKIQNQASIKALLYKTSQENLADLASLDEKLI